METGSADASAGLEPALPVAPSSPCTKRPAPAPAVGPAAKKVAVVPDPISLIPGCVLKELQQLDLVQYTKQQVNDLLTHSGFEEIGKGGFATVYKAQMAGVPVAVKVLREESYSEALSGFCSEVLHLHRFRHPHIVVILGFSLERPAVILEFAEGGDLFSWLRKRSMPLTWRQRIAILQQVAEALAFIHSADTSSRAHSVHLDVTARNVLLKTQPGVQQPSVRLCDFGVAQAGLCCVLGTDDHLSQHWFGSKSYADPLYKVRGADGYHHYSTKTDVFSLGLVGMQIMLQVAATWPNDAGSNFEIIDLFKTDVSKLCPVLPACWKDSRNPCPESTLKALSCLLLKCTDLTDAANRPNSQELSDQLLQLLL